MSKKYKGKLCVYCTVRPSCTADHVVAREFFLPRHRGNLPKAPACEKCNGNKSALEHYLTAVLPFGARHKEAAVNLQTMVPKRLQRNAKLLEQIKAGFTGERIPLEPGKLEELFVFIAKGLLWHHWRVVLGSNDRVAATGWLAEGEAALFSTLSHLKPQQKVHMDLGDGTLVYDGLQTIDSPQSSLWLFRLYGGMRFARRSEDPQGRHSLIFAATGPRDLMPRFWATALK